MESQRLRAVLRTATGTRAEMLARLRIPEKEFEIEENAESLSFVRKGQKMGTFYLFGRSYLPNRLLVRNPSPKEADQANAYQRSKRVIVEVYADAIRGPQFEVDAGSTLVVFDTDGRTYDAFKRASEFGIPADILLTAVVASAVKIFFEKKPPQTEPPTKRKIGVLGL